MRGTRCVTIYIGGSDLKIDEEGNEDGWPSLCKEWA